MDKKSEDLMKEQYADPTPHPTGCNIKNHNPVHEHEDGTWWWYEEFWTDENGPYDTEDAARAACRQYIDEVLEGIAAIKWEEE